MESTSNVLYLLILVVVTLILAARLGRRGRGPNLPPGPKPWPIFGNLNLIGPLPHRTFHDLSRKYGPLMYLKLGSFGCVVGSSAELAKAFLKTHDLVSADRPKTAAGKFTAYNYSDITWAPYGAYWRQARKMCMLELFSVRRLDSFAYIREEETKAMMKGVFERCASRSSQPKNVPINLKDVLSTVSLNVITRMVLGKKYADEHESDPTAVMSPGELKEALDELFLLNGVLNIGDSIPWLGFLDLQGYVKRMKVASKKFDGFIEHVLEEHTRRRSGVRDYVARDMVDVLLQLAEDPNLEIKLERNGVKAFTLDLIGGGTESSAVTVEWAMSELLRKPEIFEKATEELERVIGRERWVEEKDIANLPYIDSIVKETLRLHPVAPMLVPRCSREDIKIDGYDIPKGTRILVNTWTIGRDPNLWDSPEEFMPDRFIGKSIDIKGHDFELLPFGSGRRMCPGHSLGLKVIQSTLANLLHGFTWKLPSNMKIEDLDMDEIYGLSTPRKVPLVTIPEPRLPTSVYYM